MFNPGSAKKLLFICCLVSIAACQRSEPQRAVMSAGGPHPTLLVAQAQFIYKEQGGKKLPEPGPALLTIKQNVGGRWQDTIIEDPDSNVFHKALIFKDNGKPCILTIGAMKASLKLWWAAGSEWKQELLWSPVFGGKWDRLRDVEVGDVTGDGQDDIVIATHDQGVVAVAQKEGRKWTVSEIDRESEIFVHEIEIGDVDGDGKQEFFATPSHPNKAKGGPQPGKVVMYKWDGSRFQKRVVDTFEKTHAKEILAADIDGKGIATLFSVFEAETKIEGSRTVRVEPVKIIQYSFSGEAIGRQVIMTLDDFQCRFLTAGDVDGDGAVELIAAAMKSGLWMLKRTGKTWSKTLIEANSSGYEHAVCIADLDQNGAQEIYVASDDQGELRSYQWNGSTFSKTVIDSISPQRITWNLTAGTL